jgi:hypothetical protein
LASGFAAVDEVPESEDPEELEDPESDELDESEDVESLLFDSELVELRFFELLRLSVL